MANDSKFDNYLNLTREEAIEQHEQELQSIEDQNEENVRLLFHLDRFVNLIDYDPVNAKSKLSLSLLNEKTIEIDLLFFY